MKILIFITTLLLSLTTYSCPSIEGTWKSCQISSSLLNPLEVMAANIFLKAYSFKFSNPNQYTQRSEIYKTSLLGTKENILNQDTIIGENNKIFWEKNFYNNSTPPEVTTFLKCNPDGMTEYITWDNLTVENYPDHEKENYPKYFKTVYIVTDSHFVRYIYSKHTLESKYNYHAQLTCKK